MPSKVGDRKGPPVSRRPMGHLCLPKVVMSFRGTSQVLSESTKLEHLGD